MFARFFSCLYAFILHVLVFLVLSLPPFGFCGNSTFVCDFIFLSFTFLCFNIHSSYFFFPLSIILFRSLPLFLPSSVLFYPMFLGVSPRLIFGYFFESSVIQPKITLILIGESRILLSYFTSISLAVFV